MAEYKVIQNVEADDKFVGPLSFKQFIFAGVTGVSLYLTFLSLSRGFWPALVFFTPIIVVAGFLAWPWGRDQPTEVWLAARIRFFIKPRRRVWNQSGIQELVTITAPKKLEHNLTKGFTGEEATSRLGSLATMLDSRGWAIKNSALNVAPPINRQPTVASNDRLLDATAFAQQVPDVEVTASDDIMDANSNNVAQHFETMIQKSESEHKQILQQKISAARKHQKEADPKQAADLWFSKQPGTGEPVQPASATQNPELRAKSQVTLAPQPTPVVIAPTAASAQPTVTSPSSTDEEALLARLHDSQAQASQNSGFGHLKTLTPLTPQPSTTAPSPKQTASATPVNPGIIELARNNDLSAATLSRAAKRDEDQHLPDDEVVIPLN